DCIESVARHAEEPFADSSMLAVYMLSKAARKHFTVALGGDGADELFAGYETYKATFLAGRYRKLPRWLRKSVLAPLARRIPATDKKYSLHKRLTRFTRAAEYGAGRDHAAWRELCYAELKQALYTDGFRERVGIQDPLLSYAEVIAMQRSSDSLNKLLGADLEFYLPNDMLTKVDRMSMAHGLEVRVPLLDTELVSFAMSVPASMKIAPTGRLKHVLRESLRGAIPRSVLEAPKSGFNVPIERWFRESLGSFYRDLIQSEREALMPFFQIASLETLLREHEDRRADNAHALFALLMFALWLRNLGRSS
ncbi:MAG: hypothetical protein KDD44_11420, partial [Bdellovibrionales bacterium]|nr:hypothetical protein [Bdellovibrionales bacterium]